MFKTIREYEKNGKTEKTVKEYATFEKALAYARRYGKGSRFLSCTILNEAGSEAYNLYPDGEEEFFNLDDPAETPEPAPEEAEMQGDRETGSQHKISREYTQEEGASHVAEVSVKEQRPVLASMKRSETDSQKEASREYMEMVLGLPEKSGKGDFDVEIQFCLEDGSVSVRTVRHRTKNRALAYAFTVIRETGSFLRRIEVRFKRVPRWTWEGRWAYQSPTKEQHIKSG